MGQHSRSWWIRAGIVGLVVGTGPLVSFMVAAGSGIIDDRNPNPVLFGILAFLAFWPSVGLVAVGIWRVRNASMAA